MTVISQDHDVHPSIQAPFQHKGWIHEEIGRLTLTVLEVRTGPVSDTATSVTTCHVYLVNPVRA